MKSYIFESSTIINDLVERYSARGKLFLLLGKRPKLAFNPSASLILNWNDMDIEKIKKFCGSEQSKNNLIIGFFSYDLGLYANRISSKNKTDLPMAILYSFENWLEEDNSHAVVKYRDEMFLKSIKQLVNGSKRHAQRLRTKGGFKPAWSPEKYKTAFDKAKKYIKSGDVYQINLSYPLLADSDSEAKDIFVQAQQINQAAMGGIFQADNFDLISLSPETFINIKDRCIETFPIKGTRGKKKNISDDLIENKLVNDKKERAELNMISDLLRNDLSIVCKPNSVKIKSSRNTTRLSKVIHTYSHITGELTPDTSSIEALLKVFPGGSISGCPKKRALEIIDGLEEYPRGPYTGSLFTLDSEDNLEANILIRTLVKKDKSISLPVGGGIVFDSKCQTEYQETLDKASSIIEAFD